MSNVYRYQYGGKGYQYSKQWQHLKYERVHVFTILNLQFVANGCVANCARCTGVGNDGKCDNGQCNAGYTYNAANTACEGI